MNATTQLLTTLRSGACLKLGGRSHRFFLLKNSTQLPAAGAADRHASPTPDAHRGGAPYGIS